MESWKNDQLGSAIAGGGINWSGPATGLICADDPRGSAVTVQIMDLAG
jgi:hypothetical protein